MKRYLVGAICLAAMAAMVGMCDAAIAAERPNIVLVLADDLGIGDLGAYNAASKIPTPHLDRIAAEGLRMTDMHSPSAVCTPTRYALLTGRYAWRSRLKSGVLGGFSPALIEPDRMTVASLLKAHGYHTAGFGKWHLGLGSAENTDYTQPLRPGPLEAGFDEYFGIPASLDMEPYVYFRNDRVEAEPTETIAASQHRRQGGGGFWRAGPIAPGFQHDEVLPRTFDAALAYLEQRAQTPGQPFFCYLPLSAPHTPWLPTPEFSGRTKIGHYGDFVVQCDEGIGRLDAALKRLGLAGDTLLIVTSDNGSHWPVSDIEKWDHRANLHYRGQKADIHEGGHRVPFVVRWPGRVTPGGESGYTSCLVDLLATAAEIVGGELPTAAGEDSFSLVAAWTGSTDARRPQPVIHHSAQGMFALRDGDWKLIEGLGSGGFTAPARVQPSADGPRGQLYNLADDPGETKNQWLERPEVVERLQRRLNEARQAGRTRPAM